MERSLESQFLRHGATAELSSKIDQGEKPPYEQFVEYMEGKSDPPIDPEITEGIIREKIENGKLKEGDFDIIISSPALRARQTSELITKLMGRDVPIHVSEYLREPRMPVVGISPEFYNQARDIEEVRRKIFEDFLSGEKVDEDMVEVYNRMERFLVYLRRVRKWTEKRPLFVAHGILARVLHAVIEHQEEKLSEEEKRRVVNEQFRKTTPPNLLEGYTLFSSPEGVKILNLN